MLCVAQGGRGAQGSRQAAGGWCRPSASPNSSLLLLRLRASFSPAGDSCHLHPLFTGRGPVAGSLVLAQGHLHRGGSTRGALFSGFPNLGLCGGGWGWALAPDNLPPHIDNLSTNVLLCRCLQTCCLALQMGCPTQPLLCGNAEGCHQRCIESQGPTPSVPQRVGGGGPPGRGAVGLGSWDHPEVPLQGWFPLMIHKLVWRLK